MNRFLYRDELSTGKEVTLTPEESHHLAKVLRLEAGDDVHLVDGRGTLAVGKIVEASGKRSRVLVGNVDNGGKAPKVTLAFGIAKSSALDFIVHRATELGIQSFQPLETQFSLKVKNWNGDRWPRVIAEVGKQCQARYFPDVHLPLTLGEWMAKRASRPLLYCDETDRDAESKLALNDGGYDLLVGAEGGFSSEETQMLKASGGLSLGLGDNRLRAETAAIVALALVKQRIGEIPGLL